MAVGLYRARDLVRCRSVADRDAMIAAGRVTRSRSVFGEEAEHQPRHEMVHVMAAVCGSPIGVIFQKLDIEPVESARCANVECVLADLLDRRDTGKRQEETEVVGKVLVGTRDCCAGFNKSWTPRQTRFFFWTAITT